MATTTWRRPDWFSRQPPVDGQVLRPDVTAEPGAVDLGGPPVTADPQRLGCRCHGLAQLVRQYEGGFVLHIEVAAEGKHAVMSVFNRLARKSSSGFFISGWYR